MRRCIIRWARFPKKSTTLIFRVFVVSLFLASFSMGEEVEEASISKVEFSGILSSNLPFSLRLEAKEIGADEINRRLKKSPLYGANSTQTDPIQRVVTECTFKVNDQVLTLPKDAIADLFDPGFVYTVHVTSKGKRIVISWAGGSGERGYVCEFHATNQRFIKREIRQLDNKSRTVVSTKKL